MHHKSSGDYIGINAFSSCPAIHCLRNIGQGHICSLNIFQLCIRNYDRLHFRDWVFNLLNCL